MNTDYPRDFRGYGPRPPDPQWPGGAVLALQFVINLEEGAARSILAGDATSEVLLVEMPGLSQRGPDAVSRPRGQAPRCVDLPPRRRSPPRG